MKKKVVYWSPFTSYVATVKAVINSAKSINLYSTNFQSIILDAVGEWDNYQNLLDKENIESKKINYNTKFNKFKKIGFVRSRIAYLYIFFKSFFPLIRFLKNDKPEYLIIHLITSLPMIIFFIFDFETKLILRISGFPKMTFWRKILWKMCSKKIYKITCPTEATFKNLSKYSFLRNKLVILQDPIISSLEVKNKIQTENEKSNQEKLGSFISDNNFYLSIGRLTKQKNFIFLIDCIKELKKIEQNVKLLIIGDGELRENIKNKIIKEKLEKNIKILSFTNNVFFYLKKCRAFILSSLWEDPGFVLIEAAYTNAIIISSNCPNGPNEILDYGKGGYLFENNNKMSFLKSINMFLNDNEEDINLKKKM